MPPSMREWLSEGHLAWFVVDAVLRLKDAVEEMGLSEFYAAYRNDGWGDGAFGMSGLDIETSVRAGVPITTIVLNNGIMATYPGGFPIARQRYGVTTMTGDYAKIAEGMGAVGIHVTKASEIVPAIKRAQQLNAEG